MVSGEGDDGEEEKVENPPSVMLLLTTTSMTIPAVVFDSNDVG